MADEIRRGVREASTVTDLESNEPDAERAWSALEDELVRADFAREDINEEEGEFDSICSNSFMLEQQQKMP